MHHHIYNLKMKKILIIGLLSITCKAYSQTAPTSDSILTKNSQTANSEKHIAIAEKILRKKGWISNRNSFYTRGMLGFIKGVYSADKKIFVLAEFKNNTNINYDVESISFLSNPVKNSVKQIEADEKIYQPVYNTEAEVINKKSSKKVVFVFEKFTIADDKNIILIMNELEGERTISLEIKPKYISNAEFTN